MRPDAEDRLGMEGDDAHAVDRPPTCISGRRPDGLAKGPRDDAPGSLAAFFAESAYLEAASVVAFERLAGELAALGAPHRARGPRPPQPRRRDTPRRAHASLSWDVAAWLEPRLTETERQQLDVVRSAARRDLSGPLQREPHHDLRTAAGLPGAREAQQLLASLVTTLTPLPAAGPRRSLPH